MENPKSMKVASRAKSFQYAFTGIATLLWEEPNTRIHALATAAVIIGGIFKGLLPWQWVAIVVAVGLVWITEALNTCIELLCNIVCNGEYHPVVKKIKDISAAAVLVASVVSLAIGIIVFLY
jgi:diacylglycerol kinase